MSTFVPGARNGFGSIFSLSSVGSTGTFTDCAVVTSIDVPDISKSTIDITSHGTTDGYEQCIAGGITKTGSVGFTAVYLSTATQQVTLIPGLMDAGTRTGWKITIAGTSSYNIWYGDGFFTDYQIGVPLDGNVTFKASLKITGKPTLASST